MKGRSMIAKRLLRARRDIPRAFFVTPTKKLGIMEMPSLIPRTMKDKASSERMSLKTSKVKTLSTPKVGETWKVPASLMPRMPK